jgi:hypothetical protein
VVLTSSLAYDINEYQCIIYKQSDLNIWKKKGEISSLYNIFHYVDTTTSDVVTAIHHIYHIVLLSPNDHIRSGKEGRVSRE